MFLIVSSAQEQEAEAHSSLPTLFCRLLNALAASGFSMHMSMLYGILDWSEIWVAIASKVRIQIKSVFELRKMCFGLLFLHYLLNNARLHKSNLSVAASQLLSNADIILRLHT